GLRAGAGDRADERLQVQRVREPTGRHRVRTRGGEPDDRVPRCGPLPLGGLRGLLRDGVRGTALRARGDGPDQREGHDPLRAHPRRGEGRDRPDGLPRPGAGRERPAGHHDVRDPLERRHPGAVPRALRRLLDRLERHDTADARPGPGLGPGRRRLRRAGPGGEVHALSRDRGMPRGREVSGHLRAGTLGTARPGPVAAGPGHRLDVPEPGHRRGHLAAAGEAGLIGGRAERRQARSSSSITGISPVRVEWLPPLGWEVTVVSTKAQSSSASTAWRKWVRASRSQARSSASSCPVTRRLPRTTWIEAAGGELCSGRRSPRRRAMTLWRSGPSLTRSSAWRPFSAVRAWFMAWVIASGRAGMGTSSEAATVPTQYRP